MQLSCVWLLSLSLMFLRFIHLHFVIRSSYLFMANIPLCEYTMIYLSIYPLMDIWAVSNFLAIMNSDDMNMYVHVFV